MNKKRKSDKAGWYQSPDFEDAERYWDGKKWTDDIRKMDDSATQQTKKPLLNSTKRWIGLLVIASIGFLIVAFLPTPQHNLPLASSKSSEISIACESLNSINFVPLSSSNFMMPDDLKTRERIYEEFNDLKVDYKDIDFRNLVTAVDAALLEISQTHKFEIAVALASEIDVKLSEISKACSESGVKFAPHLVSEVSENEESIDAAFQGQIPDGFTDLGEGLAFSTSAASTCGPDNFGCTELIIFAYKNCPIGVTVYSNFYDSAGNEVARSDNKSAPVKAGKKVKVMVMTGLNTAATSKPNTLICE